jgi:hypothetical protein
MDGVANVVKRICRPPANIFFYIIYVFIKRVDIFFNSKGYVYLFFDTEGTYAVMLIKDAD